MIPMNKILVADLNQDLIEAVQFAQIPCVLGDYFLEASKVKYPVLMTASNPRWTFGGGIDANFAEKYPFLVQTKRFKGGQMERIQNITFTITVDDRYQATKETIKEAIVFALSTLNESETLVLSGVGTGIGGLSVDDFVQVLKEIVI